MRVLRWCVVAVVAGLFAVPTVGAVPPDSVPPDNTSPDGELPFDSLPLDTSPEELPDEDDVVMLGPDTESEFQTPFPILGDESRAGTLIPIPAGCVAPDPARVVFIGTLLAADTTTGRFAIERVLAGSADGYAVGRIIDVRYGVDARFLEPEVLYVVGAGVERGTGVLVSKVREEAPLFGGDAVIGMNDTDVECPRVEDPVRTLLVDGTAVDSGVFTPLKGAGDSLLWAVLRPFAVGFLVLLGLVLLKHLVFAVGRSLRDVVTGGDDQPPVPRRRRHGEPVEGPVDVPAS